MKERVKNVFVFLISGCIWNEVLHHFTSWRSKYFSLSCVQKILTSLRPEFFYKLIYGNCISDLGGGGGEKK